VRPDLEEIWVRAGSHKALSFLRGCGINVTIRSLQRHIQNHAPYLRAGIWLKRSQDLIKAAVEEHAEAEVAVQNIINIGNKMVLEGALPVTERLFVESLKLQSKNKQVSSLRGFLDEIESGAFSNAELVDDNKKQLASPVIEGETVEDDIYTTQPTPNDPPLSSETPPSLNPNTEDGTSIVSAPETSPEPILEPPIKKKIITKPPLKKIPKAKMLETFDDFKPFFPEAEGPDVD